MVTLTWGVSQSREAARAAGQEDSEGTVGKERHVTQTPRDPWQGGDQGLYPLWSPRGGSPRSPLGNPTPHLPSLLLQPCPHAHGAHMALRSRNRYTNSPTPSKWPWVKPIEMARVVPSLWLPKPALGWPPG